MSGMTQTASLLMLTFPKDAPVPQQFKISHGIYPQLSDITARCGIDARRLAT
jgi:hypothetical protein